MAKKTTETKTVTCTATGDLYEGGIHYKKGDTFECEPERAESLGDAVTFTAPTPV
jgi:hypothetical protein